MLNIVALIAKINAYFTTNGVDAISGSQLNETLKDLAQSSVNKITDVALLGLSEYKPSRPYLAGVSCLKNGTIVQARVDTTGTYAPGDWNVIYDSGVGFFLRLRSTGIAAHVWEFTADDTGMLSSPGRDLGNFLGDGVYDFIVIRSNGSAAHKWRYTCDDSGMINTEDLGF